VPVLLIGGDRDPSLGPMKVMHQTVRGARLVVLSPASHFANRDQPEAWNRAALEFLAEVEGRGAATRPRPAAAKARRRGGHRGSEGDRRRRAR
jgi:hypothetical protein